MALPILTLPDPLTRGVGARDPLGLATLSDRLVADSTSEPRKAPQKTKTTTVSVDMTGFVLRTLQIGTFLAPPSGQPRLHRAKRNKIHSQRDFLRAECGISDCQPYQRPGDSALSTERIAGLRLSPSCSTRSNGRFHDGV